MPIPRTTPNVKYAFSPIPGAKAKGKFAHNPITVQPIKAATAVAKSMSAKACSFPAWVPSPIPNVSIAGLTSRIYAIVRKVVIPALISPSKDPPFSVYPKYSSAFAFSIFSPFLLFRT